MKISRCARKMLYFNFYGFHTLAEVIKGGFLYDFSIIFQTKMNRNKWRPMSAVVNVYVVEQMSLLIITCSTKLHILYGYPTFFYVTKIFKHMYILKANNLQVWKNISKPWLGYFRPKIRRIGENFSLRGSKIKSFEI